MKVDRSNREKDARGKFMSDSKDYQMSRPYTEKEIRLIKEYEKKKAENKNV